MINILLIEDEEAHAELINRSFAAFMNRYQLITAGNLQKAREILEHSKPALVITDMLLPDGKGTDILKPDDETLSFPVIIMTSHGNEEMAVQAIKLGALDYIVKSEAAFIDMPRVAERALREWDHISQRRLAEVSLKESEEKYRILFDMESDALALIDTSTGKMLDVNKAFLGLYGYQRSEVLEMKNTDFSAEPEETIKATLEQKTNISLRWHKKKDGTRFPTEITANFFCYQGRDVQIAAVRDITKRRQAEEEIMAAIREKETLLHEIHHRVKNNMQIIASLLKLQLNTKGKKDVDSVLRENMGRVYAMAAIHESLHQTIRLSEIDFKTYLHKLSQTLIQTYSIDHGKVSLQVDAPELKLAIDIANPLGLVLNELISNALQYAFPDDQKCTIMIKLSFLDEETIELVVTDDGIGMPNDFDWEKSESLGLKLVQNLVENQLDGSIDLDSTNGTRFTIKFNLKSDYTT